MLLGGLKVDFKLPGADLRWARGSFSGVVGCFGIGCGELPQTNKTVSLRNPEATVTI